MEDWGNYIGSAALWSLLIVGLVVFAYYAGAFTEWMRSSTEPFRTIPWLIKDFRNRSSTLDIENSD